jgi:DNA repair protein RecO (recombination protein O)
VSDPVVLDVLVLGHGDQGEADRVLHLLSPVWGRVDAYARGARASRRRFAGLAEPGTRVRATLRRGRVPGDWSLIELDLLAAPHRARQSYDRLLFLGYGCEVARTLTVPESPADKPFGLLEAWLAVLEADPAPGRAARVAYEAKALTFAGLTPALTRCAVCGEARPEAWSFDAEAGGAVHRGCGAGRPADVEDLARIERLRRAPLSEAHALPAPQGDAAWWLCDFLEHHARRALRSRVLLSTIEEGG